MENGTNQKRQFYLFVANGKQKFVFLGRRTTNGSDDLQEFAAPSNTGICIKF
jgi:hypothetical protein